MNHIISPKLDSPSNLCMELHLFSCTTVEHILQYISICIPHSYICSFEIYLHMPSIHLQPTGSPIVCACFTISLSKLQNTHKESWIMLRLCRFSQVGRILLQARHKNILTWFSTFKPQILFQKVFIWTFPPLSLESILFHMVSTSHDELTCGWTPPY